MDKSPIALLELVERLGNLMRAQTRQATADADLAPVQVQALQYLARANRYSNTPQAIGDYLGLTKGTVSQTLLLLDRRGLVERFQDDLDRRVVRLRLSAAGEKLMYEAQPYLAWANATRNISPNRIRNAVSALRETLAQLHDDVGGKGFGDCTSCSYCRKLSQRVYQCTQMGDRLAGPDLKRICWLYEAKAGAEQG
jgi:MarR family transcriptional regulator, negative regulator of the multidrug operon emrRAB